MAWLIFRFIKALSEAWGDIQEERDIKKTAELDIDIEIEQAKEDLAVARVDNTRAWARYLEAEARVIDAKLGEGGNDHAKSVRKSKTKDKTG